MGLSMKQKAAGFKYVPVENPETRRSQSPVLSHMRAVLREQALFAESIQLKESVEKYSGSVVVTQNDQKL
jgi:hypothetical protein